LSIKKIKCYDGVHQASIVPSSSIKYCVRLPLAHHTVHKNTNVHTHAAAASFFVQSTNVQFINCVAAAGITLNHSALDS
jgi:hypothetical protein